MKPSLLRSSLFLLALLCLPLLAARAQTTGTWTNADDRNFIDGNGNVVAFWSSGFVSGQHVGNWSGVPFPGSGGVVNAILDAPGNTICDVQVTLNNLTIVSGGQLTFDFGSTLTVTTTDIQRDGTLVLGGGGGGTPTYTNTGTFTKSAGTGSYTFDDDEVLVSTAGSKIVVTSGTLQLPGGVASVYTGMTFQPSAGAVINLVGPAGRGSRFNGTITGVGAGTVRLSVGEVDAFTNATLNFPGSMFQWSGGDVNNLGGQTLTNAGTLNLTGPVGFDGNAFVNDALILQSGAGTPNMPFGTIFTNAANGTYQITNNLGVTVGGGGGPAPAFNNVGLLLKSAGVGTTTFDGQLAFNNLGGTIQLNTGTLVLPGNGMSTGGKFVVASGATLNLTGGNNAGRFAGAYTGSGSGKVLLSGGTLNTSTDGTGATFNFPAPMFQWSGGAINGDLADAFVNLGTMAIIGPVGVANNGLTNSGLMTQSGTGTLNLPFGTGFTNNATGIFNIADDHDITNGGGGGQNPFFNNAGTLEKTAGAGTSTFFATFNNTGTLLLDSGTLAFNADFTQTAGVVNLNGGNLSSNNNIVISGGSVEGTGTITGSVVNNGGIIAPGHSPGKITITGNYTQGADGELDVQIGGKVPGTGYDQLKVLGGVSLSGDLKVTLINGFKPTVGDVYTVVTDSSISGTFSKVTITGFTAQVDYSTNGVTLTITSAAPQLLNISTRLKVLTGDNVLIGGFIVTGTEAKQVIIRGIGPSLTAAGVSGALADPVLELHEADGKIVTNDNWKDTQQAAIAATGLAPTKDKESAILATLAPGNYTAILSGKNGSEGVALVEAYDLDQAAASELANISTRGFVDTGDNVLIGGFIIGGGPTGSTTQVLVRALGPSLTAAGVAGALADPTLELHDANGNILKSNNNWKDTQKAAIEATGLAPTNDKESAILDTLAPGNYTAIVRGVNSGTGVGLVEVYNLK